jgi:prepilin-type N-terminal cleavage/methylation domain-containing protein
MTGPGRHATPGTTLLELLVVLAILAILVSVVAFNWTPGRWSGTQVDGGPQVDIERAARISVTTGSPVTITVDGPAGPASITALPDGRVLGAEAVNLDPLTGR